jgi:hypothetical protein
VSYQLDHHRYDDDSTILDGQKGDLLYWPHDYWHIGEAVRDSGSMALSVALFMGDDGCTSDLLGRARGLVQRRIALNADQIPLHPGCIDTSLSEMKELGWCVLYPLQGYA